MNKRPKNKPAVQNESPISRAIVEDKAIRQRLDWSIVQARMDAMDITTMDQLVNLTKVERSTLYEAKRTDECSKKTFAAIMKGLDLREDQLRRLPMRQDQEGTNTCIPPSGWSIESTESTILVAANGVSYRIAKLRSENIRPLIRYARGKFYDTLHAPPVTQEECRERLTRHATICAMLSKQARVPQHLDMRCLNEGTGWWVIDEWIPSMPLSSLIENGLSFPHAHIKAIGTQLLETLSVLHSHRCIVRELTPERILIEDDSINCYITDFEMAQLLDSDISVSGKWKCRPPYRALEVSEHGKQWQSDLYSWAMIMVELFSGSPKSDEAWVQSHSPTPAIAKLLIKCLDNLYHHRPASIAKVMAVWNKWNAES